MTQQSKEKKTIVKKHVNAIHCSNNLTLVQRKLFNALLHHAYHDMPTHSQYQIPIKKLCQLIGYESRDYKKIRSALMDLITTAIEWNVLSNSDELEDEKWQASAIISAAKIEKGICTYEFSSIMRELLYQPEIYGKIDLNTMSMFGSGYGLALYENCIRFQGIPQTPWFPLEVFRKLIGVSKNAYQKFGDFKKRVLDIAVNEVNKYTHLKITPEIQRQNQKVTKIRFKLINDVKLFDCGLLETSCENPELSRLERILAENFGLASEQINEIITAYDANYINDKIKLIINSLSYQQGKIKSLAAYLMDALAKDYRERKPTIIGQKPKRLGFDEREFKQQKQQEDLALQERSQQRKMAVDNYIRSLSTTAHKDLINEFETYLKDPNLLYILKKIYRTWL